MLTTKQTIKKYGQPNVVGHPYLVTIELPYPMRLAWDTKTSVRAPFQHIVNVLGLNT